jgi:hypothetical protein
MAGDCCPTCEQAYQEELADLSLTRWWWSGFAVAWPLMPLCIGPIQGAWRNRMWVWGALPTGLAMVEAALMTFVFGLAIAEGAVWWRKRRHRRQFVGEHHLAPAHPRLAMPRSRR